MRGVSPTLCALSLAGIITPASSSGPDEDFADPRGNVEISFVRSDGDLLVYRLRSKSTKPIAYYHWTLQGAVPAAYCRGKDDRVYECSETITMTGDELSGYTPWFHRWVLDPMDSVTFKVRGIGATSVGVKFPLPDEGGDLIIWADSK